MQGAGAAGATRRGFRPAAADLAPLWAVHVDHHRPERAAPRGRCATRKERLAAGEADLPASRAPSARRVARCPAARGARVAGRQGTSLASPPKCD